jgi:Transcription factor WhiB
VPWLTTTPRPAASAAGRELQRDPHRSNQVIAAALRCSPVTVFYARRVLERSGAIPHVPPAHRIARPRPQSSAALAVAQGASSPRSVAEAASVTLRTAQRQLARARPAQHDAAAAADAISVRDDTPSPGSRATEALLAHPRRSNYALAADAACDEATIRRARQRLERSNEILAYVTEERDPKGPPGQPPGPIRRPPKIPDLPKPPDWSEGTCAHVPPSQQGWWTSQDPVLREAAANLCLSCPVLQPCAEFSLALPVHDPAIYGGMSQVERLRRKHAQRQQAMPKPSPRNLR